MLILSAPIFFTLEITSQCNNHCIGCGNAFTNQRRPPLSSNKWQELFAKILPSAESLRFSGGEPTLHPEFESVIRIVKDSNISFLLFTNGRWQKPIDIVHLLKVMKPKKGLLISLHGTSPEIHDSFTGVKGSFQETVGNIKKSVENGLSVATNTVIDKANYSLCADIIGLSQKLGAERAIFSRFIPVKGNSRLPSSDKLREAISAIETCRKNGADATYSVCIPTCFQSSASEGCFSGVASCVIDPWGNVRPCPHSPLVCGNLFFQSMDDIWHGEKMDQWRKMVPEGCYNCKAFGQCHGGCRAAAIAAHLEEDPLKSFPLDKEPEKKIKEITLFEGAVPKAEFRVRYESFGLVLINGNSLLTVSRETKSLLDSIDGIKTLKEIEKNFGQGALDLIGRLYHQGMIDFINPDN